MDCDPACITDLFNHSVCVDIAGAWTMGNLGRAGYGATNYGTWPYSYDSCDVGVLHNQTDPETGGPPAALWSAWEGDKGLSYLPGT